jgi:LPXTG-motif cell wall-anchored protein
MVCLAAASASAQSTTTTSTESKQFEIIAVDGNDLVVRTAEGTRQLTVPQDFRLTVDGRPVSIQELKAGMRGMATVTTTTTMTPVTVTEVKNGTVVQVTPMSIVVRTDQGVRSFTQSDVDKRGVKILRDGKPAQLSDFSPGDYLTATIVTTMPPTVVTERALQATLNAPEASPEPPAEPAQAEVAPPEPAAQAAPEAEAAPPAPAAVGTTGVETQAGPAPELPKTAGPMPLIALAGLTALTLGAALAGWRRRHT